MQVDCHDLSSFVALVLVTPCFDPVLSRLAVLGVGKLTTRASIVLSPCGPSLRCSLLMKRIYANRSLSPLS